MILNKKSVIKKLPKSSFSNPKWGNFKEDRIDIRPPYDPALLAIITKISFSLIFNLGIILHGICIRPKQETVLLIVIGVKNKEEADFVI